MASYLDAACRDVDPEWFYPVANRKSLMHDLEVARAKSVCARCPILDTCREWVMSGGGEGLPWGIAGGMTEDERKEARAQGVQNREVRAPSSRCKVGAAARRAGGYRLSIKETAAAFGVSRRTAERWRQQVRAQHLKETS